MLAWKVLGKDWLLRDKPTLAPYIPQMTLPSLWSTDMAVYSSKSLVVARLSSRELPFEYLPASLGNLGPKACRVTPRGRLGAGSKLSGSSRVGWKSVTTGLSADGCGGHGLFGRNSKSRSEAGVPHN